MKNELFILIQIQKNIETCYYNQRLMKIFIFLQTLLMIYYTRIMPETVLVGWLMSMPLYFVYLLMSSAAAHALPVHRMSFRLSDVLIQ